MLGFHVIAVLFNSFSKVACFTDVDLITIGARNSLHDARELLLIEFVFHRPHSLSELARRHVSDVDFIPPKDSGQTFAYAGDVRHRNSFFSSPCHCVVESHLA